MNKVAFLLLVSTQVIIIVFLLIKIFNKSKNILGTIIYNPINKESTKVSQSDTLKFFFEPVANFDSKEKVVGFINRYSPYHINADTLRDDKEYSIDKQKKTYRIVSLGDSFTFGHMIENKDSYPKQLENMLQQVVSCKTYEKTEVINLGVPGYDIQYSVERFRLRGLKYNPDLIIWLFKDDDFTQIQEIINPLIEENIKKGLPSWDEINRNWPAIDNAIKKFTGDYGLDAILKLQANYLLSIKKYFSGKLILVSLTDNQEYNYIMKKSTEKIPNSYFFKVNDLGNDMTFVDGHPNEKGYKKIAEELFNYIKNNSIVTCVL